MRLVDRVGERHHGSSRARIGPRTPTDLHAELRGRDARMLDELGRTLLRLSMHDERAVEDLVGQDQALATDHPSRTALVAQVAALICLDADTTTFQVFVERALAADLQPEELLGVLRAVAPLVGAPRVVTGAASLARALGYDLDGELERHGGDTPSDPTIPRPLGHDPVEHDRPATA